MNVRRCIEDGRDMEVADWVGRKVRIAFESEGSGEVGTVLAVDDTPWRPSAWVRVREDRDYAAYRSADLCWLIDVETGERGPTWGTEEAKIDGR